MSRELIPFWAAAASGRKVTYNRPSKTATIDGTTYTTSLTAPLPTVPTATVTRRSTSVIEGQTASWWINTSIVRAQGLNVNIIISQTGSYVAAANIKEDTVRIEGGDSRVGYTVPTIDDTEIKANGSVTLTIRDQGRAAGWLVGTPGSATITIVNNDQLIPTLTITRQVTSGVEGSNIRFNIKASAALTSTITVNLNVSQAGNYLNSADLGNKAVTISAGETGRAYILGTIDDTTDETDGSVTLALRSGTGYKIGTPSSATITITDDDTSPTRGQEETSLRVNLGSGNWRGMYVRGAVGSDPGQWVVMDNQSDRIRFFSRATNTEQTGNRINLGRRNRDFTGVHYYNTVSDGGRWIVLDNSINNVRSYNTSGAQQGSERISVGTSSWTGLYYTFIVSSSSRRLVLTDDTNNALRFFDLLGAEQTSERINLGTGNWRGAVQISGGWAVVDDSSNRIRFFRSSGVEDTGDAINLGSGTWWGLGQTNNNYVVVDDTSNRLRFFKKS